MVYSFPEGFRQQKKGPNRLHIPIFGLITPRCIFACVKHNIGDSAGRDQGWWLVRTFITEGFSKGLGGSMLLTTDYASILLIHFHVEAINERPDI